MRIDRSRHRQPRATLTLQSTNSDSGKAPRISLPLLTTVFGTPLTRYFRAQIEELRRLHRGRRDVRIVERHAVGERHGTRAMRTGRRDEHME